MSQVRQFTAVIQRESDAHVALCPELDIASQGLSVEDAGANLGRSNPNRAHPERAVIAAP